MHRPIGPFTGVNKALISSLVLEMKCIKVPPCRCCNSNYRIVYKNKTTTKKTKVALSVFQLTMKFNQLKLKIERKKHFHISQKVFMPG